MNKIESLIGIFTIDKGKIKVMMMRKKSDPYKGYWVLPGAALETDKTLEESINETIDTLGLPKLYTEQCYTFSEIDRHQDERVVATSYLGLIDNITLVLKSEKIDNIELEWFDINSIPKTAYDHDKIIERLIIELKKKIINSNILKILFPSDFTLPELQKVYEQLLDVKLDRRNFRKKLINLNYIVDTGDVNEGFNGRPAKLYRFNEEIEEKNLF